jgi:hypothetical protein
LKPIQFFYLNRWGCSYCQYCGVFAGTPENNGLPVSVYTAVEQEYRCVNPECGKSLDEYIGSFELRKVFESCPRHCWKELSQDIFLPSGKAVGEELRMCTKCSVLQICETSDSDQDYCPRCHRTKPMCVFYGKGVKKLPKLEQNMRKKKQLLAEAHQTDQPDDVLEKYEEIYAKALARFKKAHETFGGRFACQVCSQCELKDSKCLCVFCDDCNLCKGCKTCRKKKKQMCKCVICEDCFNTISCARKNFVNRCECDNSLSLSE